VIADGALACWRAGAVPSKSVNTRPKPRREVVLAYGTYCHRQHRFDRFNIRTRERKPVVEQEDDRQGIAGALVSVRKRVIAQ
jgi:hypothetical protein